MIYLKCNMAKNVTNNALQLEDIALIQEGLSLLEADIHSFLEAKDFSRTSPENAQQNLSDIASVRKQLEQDKQAFSKNELKCIFIGLNFLRDDLDSPKEQRSIPQAQLQEDAILEKLHHTSAVRQKIIAAFSRMGVDILESLRGF